MKTSKLMKPARAAAGLMAALLSLIAGSAVAADGFWAGRGAQAFNRAIWGGLANWVNSSPANSADSTAYFTNTFINGYVCIVNTERIIGNIWYTDPANATDFTLATSPGNNTLTLAVSDGSPVINVTQGARKLTIMPIVAGTAGLTKIGAGTLVLTNANTYTGSTVVSNGTLKLWTASYATTAVIVNDGTKIAAVVTATDAQLGVPGPWTNADNSTLIIDYGTNFPGTTAAAISVASLSLGTNLTLRVSGNSFVTGQSIPLITWTDTGPTDTAAFSTLTLPPDVDGNFSVSGNTLYLNVTFSRGPVTWNTGSGVWDTNTPNWLDDTLTATTFVDTKDSVIFDDAGGVTGNPTVTLNSTLSPLSVTMNSASHHYTLSGSGGIGGAASLTLDAANTQTLTLATTNTYSGNTTIDAGTLQLGAANVLPAGTGKGRVTVNAGGTLDLNTFSASVNSLNGAGVVDTVAGGSPILMIGADNSASSFSGVLQNTAGTLNLVKIGTGQLSLERSNTFTGTVTVNGGNLSFTDPNALSTVSGISLGGGAFLSPSVTPNTAITPTVDVVINAPITLGASGTTSTISGNKLASGVDQVARMSLNGPITGAGDLTFLGVNVGAGQATTLLNAQSTYAGNTLISCDVNGFVGLNMYVQLGVSNALPPATVLTLDGLDSVGRTVALDLNGFDQILAGLNNVPRDNRLQQILNSSATPAILTVNNSDNYTFSGQLGYGSSINFGLTKTGAGTLTLSGSNICAGPTTISTGKLLVNGSSELGTVTVEAGATLGGNGTMGGQVTVLQGSVLSPGTGTNAGRLSIGFLYVQSGATVAIKLNGTANGAYDQILPVLDYTLAEPTLALTLGYTPATGDQYTIIDGGLLAFTDGHFAGLPDGATFVSGGYRFQIQYQVGNGNAVVLTCLGPDVTAPVIGRSGPLSGTSFPLTFGGPIGQSYQVLTSTNVALPLASWAVLSAGTFGASPVTYTDTSATNGQQFYIIKSP